MLQRELDDREHTGFLLRVTVYRTVGLREKRYPKTVDLTISAQPVLLAPAVGPGGRQLAFCLGDRSHEHRL